MGLHDRGKVKIRGYQVSLIESDSGTWTASTSDAYASGPTRDAAIKAMWTKHLAAQRESKAESARQDERRREHEARTTECAVCRVRVRNIHQHAKSKQHQNAIAYENYRRSSRY